MSKNAILEMISDWFGASKAYTGEYPVSLDTWSWFKNNGGFILDKLHPVTAYRVKCILSAWDRNNET
jgi:hypothetical protein